MPDPTLSDRHPGVTPLLQTIGLTKRYGGFLANDCIDIEIRPQEIHALLGENGAGKSTLVKTVYGLIQPSEGKMLWQGQDMILAGPAEARARGQTGVEEELTRGKSHSLLPDRRPRRAALGKHRPRRARTWLAVTAWTTRAAGRS